MLDTLNIPTSLDYASVFYFAGTNVIQTWNKPRNCRFIYMITIGGGAGGGGGGTATGAFYASGGQAGTVSRALYPASMIPNTIGITIGAGGAGGAPLGNGSTGGRTIISILDRFNTATTLLCATGTTNAQPGVYNASITPSGATVLGTSGAIIFAMFSSNTGRNGNVSGTVDLTTTPLNGTPIGGAASHAGYGSTNITPAIPSGLASTTGNGGNGIDGQFTWAPFISFGGSGGGSSTVASGGNGGNGAFGAGGGGGGYGPTGGGRGGRGGDGLAVIIAI
jgi:hypothetical protein